MFAWLVGRFPKTRGGRRVCLRVRVCAIESVRPVNIRWSDRWTLPAIIPCVCLTRTDVAPFP